MIFHRSICVLAVLANSPTGATAGEIANRAGGYDWRMSKGQAERLLKQLVLDKYVRRERVAYRPGMDKILYHMTPTAASMFDALASEYAQMEKQMELPVEESK